MQQSALVCKVKRYVTYPWVEENVKTRYKNYFIVINKDGMKKRKKIIKFLRYLPKHKTSCPSSTISCIVGSNTWLRNDSFKIKSEDLLVASAISLLLVLIITFWISFKNMSISFCVFSMGIWNLLCRIALYSLTRMIFFIIIARPNWTTINYFDVGEVHLTRSQLMISKYTNYWMASLSYRKYNGCE